MPNWCNNKLIIYGSETDLSEFKKRVRLNHSELSFHNLLPMPKEILKTDFPFEKNEMFIEKYGADNWLDWAIKNWSTKWDAYHADIKKFSENELIYEFDTAWEPPINWLRFASEMFPGLEFHVTYVAENGVGGEANVKNGKVLDTMGSHESHKAEEAVLKHLMAEDPKVTPKMNKGNLKFLI